MENKQELLENLYTNPKSKGFVNHLVQAYLPVNKTQKVFVIDGPNHSCSICKHPLIDLQTIMTNMNDSEYMTDTIKDMSKMVNGESIKVEDSATYKHLTKGAVLALTGEKTTTLLCTDCARNLLEFTTNKLFSGNPNITWIMNKMRRGMVFDQFRNSPKLERAEIEKINTIEKKIERSPSKTTTFGDLDILKQLKEKMESK